MRNEQKKTYQRRSDEVAKQVTKQEIATKTSQEK